MRFHGPRVSLSATLAPRNVIPRAAQALMRHCGPRLTASGYANEKLLPLAAELGSVPAIRDEEDEGQAEPDLHALVAALSPLRPFSLLQTLSHCPKRFLS